MNLALYSFQFVQTGANISSFKKVICRCNHKKPVQILPGAAHLKDQMTVIHRWHFCNSFVGKRDSDELFTRKFGFLNLLCQCGEFFVIQIKDNKLQRYLAQIDRDAQEMFDLLVRQLAEQEGITEQLKAEDQMEWVQCMNSIHSRATEIVNNELIYV